VTLPNREGQFVNGRIRKALRTKRFHEKHATRARRLAQELIREARASGVTIWE
jgi:hypothetical protein